MNGVWLDAAAVAQVRDVLERAAQRSRLTPHWRDDVIAGQALAALVAALDAEPEPQIAFFDAVRDDPEMTDEQKIYWLHESAKDYSKRLDAIVALALGTTGTEAHA